MFVGGPGNLPPPTSPTVGGHGDVIVSRWLLVYLGAGFPGINARRHE